MGIFNEIQKGQLEGILHRANILGDEEVIQKAFSAIIEKGGKANIGEVREWKGGKFKKTPHGWEPVTERKEEGKKELVLGYDISKKSLTDYPLTKNGVLNLQNKLKGREIEVYQDKSQDRSGLSSWTKNAKTNGGSDKNKIIVKVSSVSLIDDNFNIVAYNSNGDKLNITPNKDSSGNMSIKFS